MNITPTFRAGDKVEVINTQGCNGLRGRVLQKLRHSYACHSPIPNYLVQFDTPISMVVNGQRVFFEDRLVFVAYGLKKIK